MSQPAVTLPASPEAEPGALPELTYRARCARFAAERARYANQSDRNANLNVALVVLALASAGIGLWRGLPLLYGVAALFVAGFVAAYITLGHFNAQRDGFDQLWTINDEGLRRLRRDWAGLPLTTSPGLPEDTVRQALAGDLDLFGHASLQHLLGTCGTLAGRTTLRRWLLDPAPPAELRRRQAAVAELAPLLDFRDELAQRGRQIDDLHPAYGAFVRWAEDDPWLTPRAWLVWLTRGLSVATLALILAQVFGLVPYPFWLALVLVNLVLSATLGRQVDDILSALDARGTVFQAYATLFHAIASQPVTAPELVRIHAIFAEHAGSAEVQMRRLARIMPLVTARRSQLYPVIQWTLLASFHTLWLLERWQRDAGSRPRVWLDTLGELEALAALATLAFDHPAWAFPEFEEPGGGQPALVTARALGHPLLPPASCVGNDVTLGPPGGFLLVTGSNMSGKSTLLRAIGVNIVLAQAGGPVCASALRLPPLVLATSIRIQDSLEQGVSYFMAELRRLKAVVDEARAVRQGGERTLLFLLDEILHGTNTSERQIAARRIIRYLVAQGAIGAVSTHDLTLADAPDLAVISHAVHFGESFTRAASGPAMSFDYLLRPGLATSTNALALMEIVGLALDGAESADG
jgi:hypothetical protein